MNREVTLIQRKLIRLWLYAPVLIAFVGLSIAWLVHSKTFEPFPIFFLALVTFAIIAIGRKVETSRHMVLPTKEEVTGCVFFYLFFVSIKVAARYYAHHDDWASDAVYWTAIGVLMAPFILFFRKLKPVVSDGTPSP